MLADDEPNIILSLEFLFRKNNLHVWIARNGNEAKEIIENQQLDLLILDIMMPDLDGYELCALARSLDHQAKAKIVFLSAKSKESDIQKGLTLGADAYITKPISTRQRMQQVMDLIT